jgi:putative tryptophan/tyrosine transport system substrate-binding protein
MRRRDLVKFIGNAVVAWPLTARAPPRDRMRRLGVLMGGPDDPLGQARATALVQGLGALNWHDGGNLHIDWRWASGDPSLYERYAVELIALHPEVLVAWGSPSVAALRRQISTIPIMLVNVTTRLAKASSRAWRVPAVISPALQITTRGWPANGWGC